MGRRAPRRFGALPFVAGCASALLVLVAPAAGSSDAAPLPPTGLSVTAATQTSITIAWSAPADPSVVKYAYFVNNVRAGTAPTLVRTAAGLTCGTTYSLAVESLTASQTVSPLVAITAATAPCSSSGSGGSSSPPPPSRDHHTTSTATTTTGTTTTTGRTTTATTTTVATTTTATTTTAKTTTASTTTTGTTTTPKTNSSVYVSPSGSDKNPCTATSPCQTFDHAYHVVSAGQTVWVLGGTYPQQQMTRDPSKVGASSNVTFRTPSGQLAVVGGISLADVHHVTFVGSSPGNLSSPSSGITLKPNPTQMNSGGDFNATYCSSAVTVQNIDMRQFGIDGSDNITIDGGTVGGYDNTGGDSHVGGPYQGRGTSTCSAENPYGILIHGVLFHDVLRTNAPAAHPDCLQFYGTAGSVVDSNTFVRCGTSNVMARPATNLWSGNTLDQLTFTNNSFSPAVQGGQEVTAGGKNDTCGVIVFNGNDAGTGWLSTFNCASYRQLVVVNNRFGGFSRYACMQLLGTPNLTYSGNLFASGAFPCSSAALVASTTTTTSTRTTTSSTTPSAPAPSGSGAYSSNASLPPRGVRMAS